MSSKLRVGVVFGGRSGEHEVSLMSATSIFREIDRGRFEPVPIGITPSGQWILVYEQELGKTLAKGFAAGAGRPLHFPGNPDTKGLLLEDHPGCFRTVPLDVIFPVLHGPYGEDGTVQGLFELLSIPYVGAGVLGSAVGMDKGIMKQVFHDNGIPTPDFVIVKRREWESRPQTVVETLMAKFGFPMFVKPANLGSSVGVTKVKSAADLAPAMEEAAKYDRRIIVEEAIDGREFECAVLGNDDPVASGAGEIIPSREFYDYHAKYVDGQSEGIIPAKLPDSVVHEIRDLAVRTFLATDGAGLGRVDFFVRSVDEKVLVNEINTIPGFTSISMYPKLFEAAGISYTQLVSKLIDLALERYADRQRSFTRWDGK